MNGDLSQQGNHAYKEEWTQNYTKELRKGKKSQRGKKKKC